MKTHTVSTRDEPLHSLRLEAYTEDKRANWDAFVADHPFAGQGHISANFALAQSHHSARNRSLMVYGQEGALLGILPLFEVQTRVLRAIPCRELKSGVEFPAGPLIKEGIASRRQADVLDALSAGAAQLAKIRGIDRIVIGYPNIVGERVSIAHFGYLPLKQYGYQESNKVYYYLELHPGEEELFKALKENCRRNIRAAISAGARVRMLQDRGEWMDCYTHSLETFAEADLTWTQEDMAIVWDEFIAPGHASAVAVTFRKQIASVVVFIHVNRAGYYWIGFNRKPYLVQGANHYALWEAILQCKAKKLAVFEVGSKSFEGEKLKGISEFKERFGGSPAYALSGVLELKPVKRHLLELADLGVTRVSPYFRRTLARFQRNRRAAGETRAQMSAGATAAIR